MSTYFLVDNFCGILETHGVFSGETNKENVARRCVNTSTASFRLMAEARRFAPLSSAALREESGKCAKGVKLKGETLRLQLRPADQFYKDFVPVAGKCMLDGLWRRSIRPLSMASPVSSIKQGYLTVSSKRS